MKIAIAAVDDNIESMVSVRAGRAPYFLILDESGKLLETIKNPFAAGGGGAGIAAAKLLVEKGVTILAVGKVGDNMATALTEANIKHHNANGSVKEVLKTLLAQQTEDKE